MGTSSSSKKHRYSPCAISNNLFRFAPTIISPLSLSVKISTRSGMGRASRCALSIHNSASNDFFLEVTVGIRMLETARRQRPHFIDGADRDHGVEACVDPAQEHVAASGMKKILAARDGSRRAGLPASCHANSERPVANTTSSARVTRARSPGLSRAAAPDRGFAARHAARRRRRFGAAPARHREPRAGSAARRQARASAH